MTVMLMEKRVVGFARDCHPPKYRPFRSCEVLQLPRSWAEELLASDRSVCDLTPKALFAPFGGPSVPRSLVRQFLPIDRSREPNRLRGLGLEVTPQ